MPNLTALIVDDEPLARGHLRRLLEELQVDVVGEAEQAATAIQLAEDLRPDLLLLDIQMPGLTGLQLAEALQQSSAETLLVFVTGYSEHALAAFDFAALDYLVKPVSASRLAKTLARARARMQNGVADEPVPVPSSPVAPSGDSAPLRRLPIRKDYAVRLIRVEEILCAVARDKRVFVRTADGAEHRTYYTLAHLENWLPANPFLRIHDSCLVNVDAVEEVIHLGGHTYAVRLSDDTQLPVSRTRYPALQRQLGIAPDSLS